MPLCLLCLGLVQLGAAVNVYRPPRRPLPFSVPFFFAGWLVGELALHWIAIGLLTTGGLIAAGGLGAPAGFAGLLCAGIAWGLLARAQWEATQSNEVLESALETGLGRDYRQELPSARPPMNTPPLGFLLRPFHSIHRPDVRRDQDIIYHREGSLNLLLDIYRQPGPSKGGRPVLLQVHGGAWVIGSKNEQVGT